MKKITIIFIALVAIAMNANAQQTTQDSTINPDGTVTIHIKTSAVCDMCKETMDLAMSYEKGVKSSELNVDTKILTVTYLPKKTDANKVRIAVTKSGYDADQLPADPKAYNNLHSCCKKDAGHE